MCQWIKGWEIAMFYWDILLLGLTKQNTSLYLPVWNVGEVPAVVCFLVLWPCERRPGRPRSPPPATFWLLQVTSHKQWHFTGRVWSSFLPGFLSIVPPHLANSMCPPPTPHPHPAPNSRSSPSRPPSLLGQTASTPRKGRQKWDDKKELINDGAATKGSCGSGSYLANKQEPLTCRWQRRRQGAKVFNVLFDTYSALNF